MVPMVWYHGHLTWVPAYGTASAAAAAAAPVPTAAAAPVPRPRAHCKMHRKRWGCVWRASRGEGMPGGGVGCDGPNQPKNLPGCDCRLHCSSNTGSDCCNVSVRPLFPFLFGGRPLPDAPAFTMSVRLAELCPTLLAAAVVPAALAVRRAWTAATNPGRMGENHR